MAKPFKCGVYTEGKPEVQLISYDLVMYEKIPNDGKYSCAHCCFDSRHGCTKVWADCWPDEQWLDGYHFKPKE